MDFIMDWHTNNLNLANHPRSKIQNKKFEGNDSILHIEMTRGFSRKSIMFYITVLQSFQMR